MSASIRERDSARTLDGHQARRPAAPHTPADRRDEQGEVLERVQRSHCQPAGETLRSSCRIRHRPSPRGAATELGRPRRFHVKRRPERDARRRSALARRTCRSPAPCHPCPRQMGRRRQRFGPRYRLSYARRRGIVDVMSLHPAPSDPHYRRAASLRPTGCGGYGDPPPDRHPKMGRHIQESRRDAAAVHLSVAVHPAATQPRWVERSALIHDRNARGSRCPAFPTPPFSPSAICRVRASSSHPCGCGGPNQPPSAATVLVLVRRRVL